MFFGWKVAATGFVIAAFAWGAGFYGPAVFLNVLHQERGWSVPLISAAITAHFLLSAMIVVQLTDLYERFGIAAVTRAGLIASAVGMVGWSMAVAPWHLFVAAIVSGAGWAATSGAAINAMVSPWFDRRRGLALSYAFNGSSLGGVLFTPLWVWLIARLGFAGAACAIAAGMLGVLWPLVGRYLTPTPAELGVPPDGGIVAETRQPDDHAAREPWGRFDRRFVTLSAAFALGLFAQMALVAHLLTRLAAVSDAATAAAMVSLMTICSVIGRLLLGTFIDRAERRRIAMFNFLVQGIGVLCLAIGTQPRILLTGCVLFGLGVGNLVVLSPLIAQAEFTPDDVPRVVAWVVAINQAVFAFAPAVIGVLYQLSGGYTLPFLLAALIQFAAAVVVRSCTWTKRRASAV